MGLSLFAQTKKNTQKRRALEFAIGFLQRDYIFKTDQTRDKVFAIIRCSFFMSFSSWQTTDNISEFLASVNHCGLFQQNLQFAAQRKTPTGKLCFIGFF